MVIERSKPYGHAMGPLHGPTKMSPGAPWRVPERLGAPGDSPGAPGN
jgi:hypothetical protein